MDGVGAIFQACCANLLCAHAQTLLFSLVSNVLRYFVVKIDTFKLEGRSNMFLSDMSSYLEAHLDLSLLPFSDHIIWPYLAYLGAYLSAPNMVKWDISKKILQNAVQRR